MSPPKNSGNTEVLVDSTSSAEWSTHLHAFADASIYQSWAYGKISWGEAQLSHLLLKRDGAVIAMAQARIVKLPVIGLGVAYIRYGPLWRRRNQPENIEHLCAITKAIRDEYAGRRKLLLRILPNIFQQDAVGAAVEKQWNTLGLKPSGGRANYRTIRVDIAPPLGEIRKRLDGKWRNQLNRSERNGLTIVEGEFSTFQQLYDEMHARKAFETTVDTHEFGRIQVELPAAEKMLILLAYKDSTPVSALISAGMGDTGIYLLGATSNEGMQYKGSYLLQWRMIERLKERGCLFYDLGGINPEANPGVYHFKRGLSGMDVTHIDRREFSGSALSSAAVRFGEWVKRCRHRFVADKKAHAEAPATREVDGEPVAA